MQSPLVSLIIFALSTLILAVAFWPEKGIYFRWKKFKMQNDRVLVEDALKHLYDCEYNALDCSLNSLSGNLNLSGDQSARLISKLEGLELVENENGRIHLTSKGRSYALRIVRIHRLWESHLANNTSVDETEWHTQAEDIEHVLSEDEANQLAAKLGNPLRDPHGDPIPSESGEIHAETGIRLNNLTEGKTATIIHLEDEPKELYSQLAALGLHPGMQITVLENHKERIKFIANGEESVLAPILANNVTVKLISETEEIQKSFESLSNIKVGEEVLVVGLSRGLRGQQRRRMLDFGIVPGTKIKAILKSLGDDPTAYEIRGTAIALRKNQSDHIYIKKI